MAQKVEKSLYQRAIDIWGATSQVDMLTEECGELIVAINQNRRARVSVFKIAEEIADVQIMCEQVAELIGKRHIDDYRREKLARLEQRISEAEKNNKGA